MGKAQSKRSVDITTEAKKGTEDEITEKMGKIEDLDKKEVVNGDATITEKADHQEKMDVDVVENDKDMTTEKEVDVQASGDSAEPQNTAEPSKDEAIPATAEEDISPLADESIKKSKKEKVKKKWSFRSISFGKKDKLKPAKSEEVPEDNDDNGGNGGDANDKTNESNDTKKDDEKTTETLENGNATPQELNDEQNGEKKPSDNKTAHTTNNSTTTETCEPVQKETAAVSSHLSEKTENTAVNNETKTSENGNGVDEKRVAPDQEPQNASAEASSDKKSLLASAATNESSATTNGEVVDKIHQNGDHGESDQAVIDKSKAQIEVNSNTDNNVSAATLDSLSSTSISPSNVPTHVHDLKASSEVPDEIVQINNDEPVIASSTDTDIINAIQTVVDPSSVDNELDVSTVVEEPENNIAQITEVFGATSSKTLDNEISSPEMLGVVDSSPPPLPISPPPSQVSVFAFTNNDDTIQTKNFEPANNNLIEEEKTEMPLPSSNLPSTETEIDSSQEIGSSIPVVVSETFDEKRISQEQPEAQLHKEDDEVDINIENKCQENKVEEQQAEAEDTNLCKDLLNIDQVMSSSVISEESNKIDEKEEEEEASVAFAATVIEEITETAAEIVNQHLQSNTEQLLFAQNNEQQIICDDEATNNDNENIIENYIEDNKTQSDQHDHPDDQDLLMCEDDQELEQLPPPVIEQTVQNSKTIECSLDRTESNSIQQNEHEMNSVNMSNNLDEIHLDPTKEFATAKDIKDNVTVAEIITCE